MFKSNKEKGFTLIEILIVVAIIGMLASIVLVGLGSFRSRGRDARRVADLRQTQNALELYYTKNGNYPNVSTWDNLDMALTGVDAGLGISAISNDPISDQTYYYGVEPALKQNYVLGAKLEDSSNPALKDDVNGTVFTVNCDNPVYCVSF